MNIKTDIRIDTLKTRIKKVYDAVFENEVKTMIASRLKISATTLNKWLNLGDNLNTSFCDTLEEICEVQDLTEVFGDEYKHTLAEHYMEEEAIEDIRACLKNYKFIEHLEESKRKDTERLTFAFEEKAIKAHKFCEDSEDNTAIQLLLMFFRTYMRAFDDRNEFYLRSIQKHSKTSKNVGLAEKSLKRRLPEEFGDSPSIVKHEGEIRIDFIQQALDYEAQKEKTKQTL
jgi:AraC-like DNA-binding protein